MAGSHEVRGSIPLGSTTDPRGARRRRRAPLFLLPGTEKKARGARLLLGVAAGWLALARLPWSLLNATSRLNCNVNRTSYDS